MAEQTLWRSLRTLALALLNATLVLLALCLWLGWNALATAERVTDDVAQTAQTVLLVRDDLASLRVEVTTLRTQLAERLEESEAPSSALTTQLAGIEGQLEALNETIAPLAADPEAVIALAVESAFAELGASLAGAIRHLRGGAQAETK